ncbi:MAG: hypothetical protein Q9226_004498 [Calogaya cf. arnoldii]
MAKTSYRDRLYLVALFFASLLHLASAQSIKLKACYKWDDSQQKITENRIFSYQANTTICSDGSLCPKTYPSTAENTTCCDAHQGKEEINYHNSEKIPTDYEDLSYYYAKGGYTIPGYASTLSSSATSSPSAVGPSAATSSSSQSAGTSSSSPSAGTSSSSPSSTPDSTPQSASSDLSSGAKAGIGVGTALGAAILAALLAVLFLLRRRNRGNENNQVHEMVSAPSSYPNAFFAGGEPPKGELISEVESMRPEMAAQDPLCTRGELPTSTTRVEMDGSHYFHA